MKIPVGAITIIVVFGTSSLLGDTWAPPVEQDYVSANGRFVAHVTPAGKTAQALLVVYELKEGNRVALWDCTLGNEGAPQQVFLTDDGLHVVTVNEVNTRVHGAWGDYVLAFYHHNGPNRHYSLEQLLGCPEKITQMEFSRLISRSVSGRYWANTMFLREFEGRGLFFAWLDQGSRWLAWNVLSGDEIEVTGPLSSFFDETARQWAIQEGLATGQRLGYDWYRAIQILQRLKRPEDRHHIEPLLGAQDFHTSKAADKRTFKNYCTSSPRRNLAERALAAWDGSPLDNGGMAVLDTYRHLGVVHGTIRLPRPPTPEDRSWLCVYLVPTIRTPDNWYAELPVHRLCVQFGKYHLSNGYVWPDTSIPFIVAGVSPGQYYLKAVWDLSSPYTLSNDRISGLPSPGDYENKQCPLIRVEAGGVIKGVRVDCTQEVGERSVTVWSSEFVQATPPEDPPCPCGKEHSKNRVCIVFKEPMPLKAFDWGPYHNYQPSTVTKNGTTTTYEYYFDKMGPDPNNTSNPEFNLCLRMAASDNRLTYVTVEGPYFSVVPFQSFLRALLVQGLDTKDPEGQVRVYGGPLRPMGLEAPLDRVIQILGKPSETKADEVAFNYTLRRETNRNPPFWIKYKTTKEGLLLEGRTNLAGGISSWGGGW